MRQIPLRQKKDSTPLRWLRSNHQTEGTETETSVEVSFLLWWKMATVNLVEESFDNTNFSGVMHSQIIQCFPIGTQIFFQKNLKNLYALLSNSGACSLPNHKDD